MRRSAGVEGKPLDAGGSRDHVPEMRRAAAVARNALIRAAIF
jgi:hypothetical protein